jgi:hypothetical protein
MNVRISRAQALLAAGALTATSVITVVGASSASAHMGVELRGSTPTAGSSSTILFRPGHGCDGDATNALSIEIPAGVTGVKAQPKAGWKLSTSNNGNTITWSGGNLPDDQIDEFGIRMTWPKAAAGSAAQKYYFKAVQTCNAELKVATKGANATITGFLPAFAGQKVALFVGDTPLTVRDVTVGADGKFSVSTKAVRSPPTPRSLPRLTAAWWVPRRPAQTIGSRSRPRARPQSWPARHPWSPWWLPLQQRLADTDAQGLHGRSAGLTSHAGEPSTCVRPCRFHPQCAG